MLVICVLLAETMQDTSTKLIQIDADKPIFEFFGVYDAVL